MRNVTARKLSRICTVTSFGDAKAARKRYRQLKRDWNDTPRPARHGLLIQLTNGALAMMETTERLRAEQNATEAQQST